MGAGASSETQTKTVQRTNVAPTTPARGSAQPAASFNTPNQSVSSPAIVDAAYSPMLYDKAAEGKWQMEEMDGHWSELPADAMERLEAAFKEARSSATCMLHGRLATADLEKLTIVLGGSAAPKRIRRVGTKGGGYGFGDPFAVDDAAAVPVIGGVSDGDDFSNGQFDVDLLSVIYAHKAPVFSECFSADGDSILSAAKDGTMKYWEVASSFLRKEFDTIDGSVLSVAMSKTAPIAASGCDDKIVRVYNLDHNEPKGVLFGHNHKVYGVNFTRDGRVITSTSMDRTLRTWDANTLANTRVLNCHTSSIFSHTVSPLSPWLVITASDDHTLASHDLRIGGEGATTRRYVGHTKTLWGCDIRYDEMQYISCGMDNSVMLWDPRQEKEPVKTITSHTSPVHCVEYLPDGAHYLSSSRDMSFKVACSTTGTVCLSRKAHDGHVFKVTYNAMKGTVMTCGGDARVKLWNLKRRL